MRHAFIGAVLVAAVTGTFAIVSSGQTTSCAPSGGLSFICGVQNPEDLVQVPSTRWLVASGMAPGSGLHIVDTRGKTARNLYAPGSSTVRADKTRYASCPGPLDPRQAVLHGLSLRTASTGRFTVYATNHGGRESIEVFELDASGPTPTAAWTGCVLMPDKMAANSVASFNDGSLVATVLIMPGKTFEDAFAGRITGAVFLWTPVRRRSGSCRAPSFRPTTASRHHPTTASSSSPRRRRNGSWRFHAATQANHCARLNSRSSVPTTFVGRLAIA